MEDDTTATETMTDLVESVTDQPARQAEDGADDTVEADDELMEQFNALDEVYYAGAEEPIAVKLFEYIRQNSNEISL